MSLAASLALRIAVTALTCLLAALAWVVLDTARLVEAETATTGSRVARQLERMFMLGSSGSGYGRPFAVRDSITVLTVMAPGMCVQFTLPGGTDRRLCSGWNTFGPTAPPWFRRAFAAVAEPPPPVELPVPVHGRAPGTVVVTADRVAVATRAWHQVKVVAGVAFAMAAAIAILSAIVAGRAVQPLRVVTAGLRRLEQGDYAARLPAFGAREFDRIASALNDLARRLQTSTAERAMLTRRLFQVQEEERRALARDLHDEFGQCLTATGALAASIAVGSPADRPDLASDARAIGRIASQMMATLKGALARLRPPDLEEMGLEASLRTMVAGWNLRGAGGAGFRLDIGDDLGALPPQTALSVYRIAQECLTNAVRHGTPSRVSVSVWRKAEDGAVAVTVEDDGGGDAERVGTTAGYGLLGIRERVDALGGALTVGQAAAGVRVCAVIPVAAGAAA
jgi:two-component system sensor histidine kinase UhpB